MVTHRPVSSYLTFSPLPCAALLTDTAVLLCCTFLGVTPTRRYLASCPTELGLSSRDELFREATSDHLNRFNGREDDRLPHIVNLHVRARVGEIAGRIVF